MLLYSKPYNYYKDNDDQNLGLKLRYAARTGIEAGTMVAGLECMGWNRPKNFAHLFSIFGRWMAIGILGQCLHAGFTYTIAKQTNTQQEPLNHLLGALGPGLLASMMYQKPYYIFSTAVVLGVWAANQKFKMKHCNTTDEFDNAYIQGVGGLYEGQFSGAAPFRRHIFTREDPGRRVE